MNDGNLPSCLIAFAAAAPFVSKSKAGICSVTPFLRTARAACTASDGHARARDTRDNKHHLERLQQEGQKRFGRSDLTVRQQPVTLTVTPRLMCEAAEKVVKKRWEKKKQV